MKIRTLWAASLIAGLMVGAAITWVNFGRAGTRLGPEPASLPLAADGSLEPRVAVESAFHDFGTVDRAGTSRHAFRISNRGSGILRLKAGKTSCSACTIADLDRNELANGETAHVVIEYTPGPMTHNFRQTATVLTNDLQQPRIELTVMGKISDKLFSDPYVANFGNVPAGQNATAEVRLLYYLQGELRVLDHEFIGETHAENFSLEAKPLEAAKLADSEASSGVLLVLTLKPGLPLGSFRQTIRLTLDTGENTPSFEYKQGVVGTIVSEISIVGAGWRTRDGVLDLGTFSRDRGVKKSVRILVRGEDRKRIKLGTLRVEPPQTRVTLGELAPLNDSVEQIVLDIEIPPGVPPMVYNGSPQSPFGEIVLGVRDYPHVEDVKLRLKLTAE